MDDCENNTIKEVEMRRAPVHEVLKMLHTPRGYDHLPTPCHNKNTKH